MERYRVACVAGTFLGSLGPAAIRLPHRWTPDGVKLSADFTGAHLLHAAVAGCVLNDLYREAVRLGIALDGVRVEVIGGFDETWTSTGIEYLVDLDSAAETSALRELLAVVDEVAEIPRALRAGAGVGRAG